MRGYVYCSDTSSMKKPRTTSTIVAVLCLVQFVDVLGVTEVLTAAPQMLRAVSAPSGDAAAVLTAYAMCFGGLLMLGARLGDRFGHRRVLLAGIALFAAASLCAAPPASAVALVAGRCLQGVAAAISVPASLRLLIAATPSPADRRARDGGLERRRRGGGRQRLRGRWSSHAARGMARDVLAQPPPGRVHRRRRGPLRRGPPDCGRCPTRSARRDPVQRRRRRPRPGRLVPAAAGPSGARRPRDRRRDGATGRGGPGRATRAPPADPRRGAAAHGPARRRGRRAAEHRHHELHDRDRHSRSPTHAAPVAGRGRAAVPAAELRGHGRRGRGRGGAAPGALRARHRAGAVAHRSGRWRPDRAAPHRGG